MRLACTIAMLSILAAASIAGAPANAARVAKTTRQAVSEGLTCQCGCGLTVANCNHPNCSFSVPARDRIDKLIAQGMDRAQIIGIFRAQYGEKVLSAPTTQGFNLLAWLMPPVAILLGALIMMLTFSRWRGPQPAPSSSEPPDSPPAAEASPALRRELERRLREGM
jgi:cytochrome c-type biogenesis protein CcmH/NrfF